MNYQQEIRYWQQGADNFTSKLFDLITKADPDNRERIAMGFPEAVEAYQKWNAGRVFGYYFQEPNNNPHPPRATTWDSVDEAVEDFAEQCGELMLYSENNCYLHLYYGMAAGDEQDYGYPDSPDHIYRHEYIGKDGVISQTVQVPV